MSTDAIYLRLSKPKPGAKSKTDDSIESQRETVHEYMRAQGKDPSKAREYVDVMSAYKVRSAARPGWAALEADARAGLVSTVWARHSDRLYRHLSDLESLVSVLDETGLKVRTAWSGEVDLATPAGRMTARVLGSIAQGEIEQMQQRVKARLDANRAAGDMPGGPRAFGYEKDGSIREPEAALIRSAVAAIIGNDGGIGKHSNTTPVDGSIRSIVRAWEASGIPTPRGGQWRTTTVRQILTRGRIAGRLEHFGEDAGPAPWPAIVSLDDLQMVRGILARPERFTYKGSTTGPTPQNLASGIAICGRIDRDGETCGAHMVASSAVGKDGGRRPTYACSKPGAHLSIDR